MHADGMWEATNCMYATVFGSVPVCMHVGVSWDAAWVQV